MPGEIQLLSIIIPVKNEADCLRRSIDNLLLTLEEAEIRSEILVIDDHSEDSSWSILSDIQVNHREVRPIKSTKDSGFGNAVREGFQHMDGDAVIIFMGDESDRPKDVITYWKMLNEGYDCVFGSRFVKGGKVDNYPIPKLLLNRIANKLIQILFGIRLNDTTNAFKAYRKEVIEGCKPLLSPHFNLTVELPLKAIIRGYSWTVVPISWRNRKKGTAKFRIKEMGSRYIFIILYAWLEKFFSRGDYHKNRK